MAEKRDLRAKSPPRHFGRGAWTLIFLIAGLLALFSAANMDISWERGIELLGAGGSLDVEGVSTDILTMVSARELLYVVEPPGAPPFKITGRDIFIAYDPWLRSNISISMRSSAVEGRISPVAAAGPPAALPLLGLFRRFSIECPRARFRILWNEYVFSCEESRLTCQSASGEGGRLFWYIPRAVVSTDENLIATLGDARVSNSFERSGAVNLSSFASGLVEVEVGRVELDMESLTALVDRERFLMTGKFAGPADVTLEGGRLMRASAELLADSMGTVAISRDAIDGYLERLADGPQRDSMKIVLENLQDYTFNRGTIRMKLTGDDIGLYVDLEGESGPRTVEFALHDFIQEGRVVIAPFFQPGG